MTFIRTSKILFGPFGSNGSNGINQRKLNDLASFIDLCNIALNFYLVNFIECYELDKLLTIKGGTKKFTNKVIFSEEPCSKLTILNDIFYELSKKDSDDKKETKYFFKRKLKFYPSGIGDGTDLRRIKVVEKKLEFNEQSPLSARTLKSVENQAFAIIKSWVKQILQSYQFGFLNYNGLTLVKDVDVDQVYKKSHRRNLIKRCRQKCKLVKSIKNGKYQLIIDKFEFNSNNCKLLRRDSAAVVDEETFGSFELSDKSPFDSLFVLSSMYKRNSKILENNKLSFPLKLHSHKHFNNLKNGIVANTQCKTEEAGLAKSFLVSKNGIEVRFKLSSIAKEAEFKFKKVGIDQGQRKLFSAVLSQEPTGPTESVGSSDSLEPMGSLESSFYCYLSETDLQDQLHKHAYNKVCDKIARRQKGSKGFKRAQDHRKNLINQAVNILAEIFNFEDDVAEVRLEKLRRLGEGKKKSRKLQAFNYADLRYKLERKCIETNVELTETSNAYRSQRCSLCGFVHKKNRINGGEEFACIKCGFALDADFNSAINQIAELQPLYRKSSLPNKTTGFYWLDKTQASAVA